MSGKFKEYLVNNLSSTVSANSIILLPQPRHLESLAGASVAVTAPVRTVTETDLPAEGYRLTVSDGQITLASATPAGAFYGRQTVLQLQRQYPGGIPALRIEDWPDFANRGFMLDISRDRVPTMATLFRLVDLLASWKINQLQLYTEHTFAYRNHREVWEHASPMTPAEIRELDQYCRDRFIELVPNQNCFGHLERWLKHAKYTDLAEAPAGFDFPWGHCGNPFSVCPTDPRSAPFIAELLAELLPNFTSRQINIGCDETYDVGQGRSHTACEQVGRGRVYLDFLKKIIAAAQCDGHTVQFWGDILQHHPDLLTEIPTGVTALEWGYGATHDFDGHCGLLAKAGVPFYVCPGTSAWNSLSGMLVNARGNLVSAALHGKKYGAAGYLNTEWGDGGHWQQWPIPLPAIAYGAAVCWALDANRDLDLPGALSFHLFQDSTGQMGRIACELAQLNQTARSYESNGLGFSIMLGNPDASAADGRCVEGKPACFQKALEALARLRRELAGVRLECADADPIRAEYEFTLSIVAHACHMGLARAESLAPTTAAVPSERRHLLAQELAPLIPEYRRRWLARSRSGGLTDSVQRFEKLLEIYKA